MVLNDPVSREGVKAAGAIGASLAGGPVAVAAVAILGVAVEALGLLGDRRTKELFNTEGFLKKASEKMRESDDFAGFVFSVWQKHNLESSKERRKLLKKFLEVETGRKSNDFENFSKIEYIIQNISFRALFLLKLFHSKKIYGRPKGPKDASSKLITLQVILEALKETEVNIHAQDVEYRVNELCNNDLIAVTHDTLGGPAYNQTKLGFILLEYIEDHDI